MPRSIFGAFCFLVLLLSSINAHAVFYERIVEYTFGPGHGENITNGVELTDTEIAERIRTITQPGRCDGPSQTWTVEVSEGRSWRTIQLTDQLHRQEQVYDGICDGVRALNLTSVRRLFHRFEACDNGNEILSEPDFNSCEACPSGQVANQSRNVCIAQTTTPPPEPEPSQCEAGFQNILGICATCPRGSVRSHGTEGGCESRCATGYYWAGIQCRPIADTSPNQSCPDQTVAGNPVDYMTGNKYKVMPVYAFQGGQSNLKFEFHYNSHLGVKVDNCTAREPDSRPVAAFGSPEAPVTFAGLRPNFDISDVEVPIPANEGFSYALCFWGADGIWKHNYQKLLQPTSRKAGEIHSLTLHRPNGRQWRFRAESDGSNVFTNQQSVYSKVEKLSKAPDDLPSAVWAYTELGGMTEYYNQAGLLIREMDTRGFFVDLSYSSSRVTKATDNFGNQLNFTYSDNTVVLPEKVQLEGEIFSYQFTYQQSVQGEALTRITYPDGRFQRLVYDNPDYNGLLTKVFDENNFLEAEYAYDADARAISTATQGNIEKSSFNYIDNLNTAITNPLDKVTQFQMSDDSSTRRRRVTRIDGLQASRCVASNSTMTYDANGYRDLVTEKNGSVTDYDYDARGLETQIIYAKGTAEQRIEQREWHPVLPLPTKITLPGRENSYTYDDKGRMLTATMRDIAANESRTTQYTYNSLGLIQTIDGPRTDVADVTTFAYDAKGNISSITNALGQVTTLADYNLHGQVGLITDANGVRTKLQYDNRQRLTSVVDAFGVASKENPTLFTYWPTGRIRTIATLANGTLNFEYDTAQRLIAMQDQLGNRIEYTLDNAGNRVETRRKDPQGTLRQSQQAVFDELSRIYTLLGANNQKTDFRYDAAGNQVSVSDALNNQTTNQFDALNRIRKTIDPAQGEIDLAYNSRDELFSVDDQRDLKTTYTRNGFGEVVVQSSPDTGVTTFAYDKAGNLVERNSQSGVTLTYAYDALNRLTEIAKMQGANKTVLISYLYDENDVDAQGETRYGIGRMTQVTDDSGVRKYRYDVYGNISQLIWTHDGVTDVTRYAYNGKNQLDIMTYPSGRQVFYSYDAIGRIVTLRTKAASESTLTTLVSGVSYEPFGPVKGFVYGNGSIYSKTYDQDFRVTGIALDKEDGEDVEALTYHYNVTNNIGQITNGLFNQQSNTYQYDALYRLTEQAQRSGDGSSNTLNYTYDAVGNRLTRSGSDAAFAQTNTYESSSNRLSGSVEPGKTRNYDYVSQVTQAKTGLPMAISRQQGGQTFNEQPVYTDFEELRTYNGAATYTYDYRSLRSKKVLASHPVASAKTTHFHYDMYGQLIVEKDGNHNLVREFVYLGNMPIAMYTGAAAYAESGTQSTEQTLVVNDKVWFNSSRDNQSQSLHKVTGDTDISATIGDFSSKSGTEQTGITLREQKAQGSNGQINVFLSQQALTTMNTILVKTPDNKNVPIPLFGTKDQTKYLIVQTIQSDGTITSEQFDYIGDRVRLQRIDNEIKVYSATTGGDWQLVKTTNLPLLDEVHAGAISTNGKASVELSYTAANNNLFYLYLDHLNTPFSVMSDSADRIIWRRNSFAKGATPFADQSLGNTFSGALNMPLRFPGQYYDQETGLYYNWHRYYDPEVGRYISSDPIGLAGGINTYGYVSANPLAYSDPSGLIHPGFWVGVVSGAVGGYLSGGDLTSAIVGAVAGGAVGLVNPGLAARAGKLAANISAGVFKTGLHTTIRNQFIASGTAGIIGGATSAGTSNYMGQVMGNALAGRESPFTDNISCGGILGSMIGGGIGGYFAGISSLSVYTQQPYLFPAMSSVLAFIGDSLGERAVEIRDFRRDRQAREIEERRRRRQSY